MRNKSIFVLCAIAILLCGCDSSGGSSSGGGGLFGSPQGAEDRYAIRCAALGGSDHVRQANWLADALRKTKALRANLVLVDHQTAESVVYYGNYRKVYDPRIQTDRFEPDVNPDLEIIRNLAVPGSNYAPFLLATIDLLPLEKPSNPSWDLARKDGYYSLHVAAFFNEGEMRSRRFAAEEYCRILREQGEEAYYHHGPSVSSVTIGIFPNDAIAEIRKEEQLTGVIKYESRIVDARMLTLQRKHPVSYQNGTIRYEVLRDRTGKVVGRDPTPSFPVVLPKMEKLLEEQERLPVPGQ
jgi:hypothetical protein